MDQFVLNTFNEVDDLRIEYAELYRKVWGLYPPTIINDSWWLVNRINGVKEYLHDMELNRWDVL
jgi:hypothetical protein